MPSQQAHPVLNELVKSSFCGLPLRRPQRRKPQLKLFLLLRHGLSLSPQPAPIFTKLKGTGGGSRGRNSDNNYDSFAPLSNVTGQDTGERLRVFHFPRKKLIHKP